jgi:predicted SprT family Zn-dependent metalloprotease
MQNVDTLMIRDPNTLSAAAASILSRPKQQQVEPKKKDYSTLQPSVEETVRRMQIVEEAVKLELQKHGLHDWSLKWNSRSKTQAGACEYLTKKIVLSTAFVARCPEAEVYNTILHEIAHAIVGVSHNHDPVWRNAARAIGCTGDRCHNVVFVRAPLLLTCVQGCFASPRMKQVRKTIINKICKQCKGSLIYVKNTT